MRASAKVASVIGLAAVIFLACEPAQAGGRRGRSWGFSMSLGGYGRGHFGRRYHSSFARSHWGYRTNPWTRRSWRPSSTFVRHRGYGWGSRRTTSWRSYGSVSSHPSVYRRWHGTTWHRPLVRHWTWRSTPVYRYHRRRSHHGRGWTVRSHFGW